MFSYVKHPIYLILVCERFLRTLLIFMYEIASNLMETYSCLSHKCRQIL